MGKIDDENYRAMLSGLGHLFPQGFVAVLEKLFGAVASESEIGAYPVTPFLIKP